SQFENIKIIHEATDRSLFASGALWAAQLLFKQQQTYGFIAFNKLVTQYLKL
ncbi:MAG: dihydrodipicolinate reductase, partial [Halobacteriovoraceae bacterium]|nr:dihydrodipicolinate reductase [Halobacteriovoraceae bacterium]